MSARIRDFLDWRRPLGRRSYFLWGFGLAALKYNLDRLVVLAGFGRSWFPTNYLEMSAVSGRAAGEAALPSSAYLILLVIAVPFIACGVGLTLRRLRDTGWPPVLALVFFVPFVNLLFFALLCLQPGKKGACASESGRGGWFRSLRPRGRLGAALLGVIASALLGVAVAWFGTAVLRNYGAGLFVGLPFMIGFFSALFAGRETRRSLAECAFTGQFALLLVAILLLAAAIEGVVCLIMAAPIASVLGLLGSVAGWLVQRETPRPDHRLYACGWIILPVLLALESAVMPAPGERAVVTACEIDAPTAVVWREVLQFRDLPPPGEWIFAAGVAYPVRARLEGTGVGAVRQCEFSTGSFVEPITAWEENRRLAFDVAHQPPALNELSPYAGLRPPHLDEFFRSRRGEFLLEALPGDRTRLQGTTWYEQRFWPQAYWQLWTDYLLHVIHRRVLTQIQVCSESGGG